MFLTPGALTDNDAFMNSATQNILSFSVFTQALIFYSCILIIGVADGLWKKSIGNGIIMTILGLAAVHTILGSPYKSMQVDFYQRVTGIGITNKNLQVNAS